MNWAPPHSPFPSAEPSVDEPSPDVTEPSPEPDVERLRNSAAPAAAWIALLGSGLVLVAAIAVVASNWDTIGQSLRVAGLLAVTGGLLLLAERARSLVPTTAGIVAHAGTYLTGFAAIAVMSLFGFTWPACLLVGGGVIALATALQAPRWTRATMHIGQVGGLAVTATGAAALLDTTAGLLAGLASVALLVRGSQYRSVGLALLAVLSPVLTALADAGIGDGTLARAGLVGERLSWSGPVVGLLAATVLAAVATRRRSSPLMLLAVLAPVFGAVTGLASIDGSAVAWWCIPALIVLAGELGIRLLPDDRFARAIRTGVSVAAAGVAAVAWLAPVATTIDLDGGSLEHPWAIPIALTALALVMVSRRWHGEDSLLTDLGIAAVTATSIGVLLAFDVAPIVVATFAVVATVAAGFASRRIGALAVYGTGLWALAAIGEIDVAPTWSVDLIVPLALLGALVTAVVALRARLASGLGPVLGLLELSVVAAASIGAALGLTPDLGPLVAMVTIATVVGLVCLVEPRHVGWGIAAVGTTGLFAFDAATNAGTLDATYWIGWAAAAGSLGLITAAHRSTPAAYAASSAAILALAALAGGSGVTPEDFTVMAMLGVVALTGLAATVARRTPLDAAAVTAGALLAATSGFEIHPAWVSAAWVVLGLQIATYGALSRSVEVAAGGALVSLAAAASWIWTTGFDDWFVDLIEPADIRSDDVWFALVSIGALVAGLAARSSLRVSTWLAYSAAMLIPALWLTDVELSRSTVWAIPLLLTIGVAATLVGAWRRLAAPLVGGTVLTVLGVFLATGSDLRAIPVWAWLALGGGTLIAAAVLIERSGRTGWSGMAELVSRWQ